MLKNDAAIECAQLITKFMAINYPNIGYFFQLHAEGDDKTLYFGDLCPACAIANATEWAEKNDIKHNEKDTIQ
jgi:hypothetical protein